MLMIVTGCSDDPANQPDCLPGTSCDDGIPITYNDLYDTDCNCAGTPLCQPGEPCDDGNALTLNDTLNADCICTGIPTECAVEGDDDGDGICKNIDCDDHDPLVTDYVGMPCDDGNPATVSDTLNRICQCVGINTCMEIGLSCNDEDPDTYQDTINDHCDCIGKSYGTLTDPRDNKTYKTFTVPVPEGQETVWMAENLCYPGGNWWYYNNDPAYAEDYGLLYAWQGLSSVCPEGWHLPEYYDILQLADYLGGWEIAGGKMKSTGYDWWIPFNTGATNESGFSGLPGGIGYQDDSLIFCCTRIMGEWWTSDYELGGGGVIPYPVTWTLQYDAAFVDFSYSTTDNIHSVRCIRIE